MQIDGTMAKRTDTKWLLLLREADLKAHESALRANMQKLDLHDVLINKLEQQQGAFTTRDELRAELKAVSGKLEVISKLVYLGLGGLAVLEFLLKYLIR